MRCHDQVARNPLQNTGQTGQLTFPDLWEYPKSGASPREYCLITAGCFSPPTNFFLVSGVTPDYSFGVDCIVRVGEGDFKNLPNVGLSVAITECLLVPQGYRLFLNGFHALCTANCSKIG